MCMTTLTASATEYITDVMLIGAYERADYNALVAKYTAEGWKQTNWDLNHGISWGDGDAILLLYKTAESTDGFNHEYITDFYIQNRSAAKTTETLNFMGREYNLVPISDDSDDHFKGQKGDLNSHTGASTEPIHLYYTKETFADNRVVTGITFNDTQSGGVGCEGNTKTGYDLNAGCSDLTSQKIYMHLSTATAPVKDCYISEVKLVGAGTSDELDTYLNQYAVDGWKVINYDLNKGINWGDGEAIYLLYKTTISPDGLNHGYITDFYLQNRSTANTTTTLNYNDRLYQIVQYVGSNHFVSQMGDLNSGTGASTDPIHLYCTTDRFYTDGRVVNGIYFNATQSGAVGKEGGTTGYSLNAGTTGSNIYMHLTTASTHKNASPIASLQSFTFSAKKRYAYVIGWAFDPDEPDLSSLIRAEVYSSNNQLYKSETFQTWVEYSGANSIYNITGKHGFGNYVRLDDAPADTYTIKLYAEDLTGDPDTQIGEAQTVTITRNKPVSYLDAVETVDNGIRVRGWAFDPEAPDEGVPIRVEVKRTNGSTYTTYNLEQTDVYRGDLNSHPDYSQYNLTGNHGFDITIPISDTNTYTVSVYADDLSEDGEVQVGTTKTVNYTHVVTLTSTTGDVTLENGDVLTGTGGADTHVVVADGATVTLRGVTNTAIPKTKDWGAITCSGDATIVLADGTTNKLNGGYNSSIYIPKGKTLTIQGNGALEASTDGISSAIGGTYPRPCGNIKIKGGHITATSHGTPSAIGSAPASSCGNITIEGGTVIATVDYDWNAGAASIGSGYNGSCGDITITNNVTRVTATRGSQKACSIGAGAGSGGTCGTVTIAGIVTGGITESPFTYEPGVSDIYTIAYNLNEGIGTGSNPVFYTTTSPDITLAEPVRFHYDFIGWTWEGQDIPVKNVTIAHGSTGNKVFTAHWEYSNVVNLDLATNPSYQLLNDEVLTGTGNADTHITIAEGATVTLSNVDITGITNDNDHKWAGISCLGNATIILAEGTTNKVKGGHEYYPGIHVPQNNTLTFQGKGYLETSSNGNGCGIGGGYEINCGNIFIDGGYIVATGGGDAQAIGSGHSATRGYIHCTNSIIRVNAFSDCMEMPIGGSWDNFDFDSEVSITFGFQDKYYFFLYHSMYINNNEDNSETISENNGKTCIVDLNERILYTDGDWNTLCLPFPMNEAQIDASFPGDAVIMELNGETSNLTNGTLTLNFTKATSIVAGRPYIIRFIPKKYTIQTADDVVKYLKVFDEGPMFDEFINDPEDFEGNLIFNLLINQTGTTYTKKGNHFWVNFHYHNAITEGNYSFVPQGYALCTGGDNGAHNPTEWVISARNSVNEEWTTLDAIHNDDILPSESHKCVIFPLDNTKEYQYFRFEAFGEAEIQLDYFQFYAAPQLVGNDIHNPQFIDVTINAAAPTATTFSGGKFVGTYAPVNFAANDKSILFLGAKNKLHWPSANMTLGAFRAYFDLGTASASEFVLNFGEGETTSLNEELRMKNEEFAPAAGWYTLSGTRLDKQPTQKGLYIHGGKKIVIK